METYSSGDIMRTYYVYVYLDPRKPGVFKYDEQTFLFEPFYVGRGFGNRFKYVNHIRRGDKTTHKYHKINDILSEELEPIVEIIFNDLSFEQSEEMECQMIYVIGRQDQGKGTLTNHTNGGKGVRGFSMPIKSEETLKRMSESQKGKKYTEETNKKKGCAWIGRQHSQEEKDKIARANTGKIFSSDHKERISEGKTGKKLNLSDTERERRRLQASKPLPQEVLVKGMRTRIRKDINKVLTLGLPITEMSFNSHKSKQTCKFSFVSLYYSEEEFNILCHNAEQE